MRSTFIDRLPATLTGEFESKIEKIPNTDKSMKLNVWDTFGEEKFRGYLKMYFKQSSAVILCFDLTSNEWFSKLPDWLIYINEHLKRSDAIFILCGWKCDLEDLREVSLKQARNFAKENSLEYFETSARENIGIDYMFKQIWEKIYLQPSKDPQVRGDKLRDVQQDNQENKTFISKLSSWC